MSDRGRESLFADVPTKLAEIRQENRGGDVSAKDIEWLCDVAAAAHEVRRSSFPSDRQAFTYQERRLTDALDG
jgi:hypothetical protein